MISDDGNQVWGRSGYNSCCIPFDSGSIQIRFPRCKRLLSDYLGKYYGYIAAALGLKRVTWDHIGTYSVLRTDHQVNPLCHHKLYSSPGSFSMDVPYGYFALYANAALTLSDRIHACVVTMAYGGSAMLFSRSPRVQVFERVGAAAISRQPTKLDMAFLEQMRAAQIGFIRTVIR
jgi:hypothetical protein